MSKPILLENKEAPMRVDRFLKEEVGLTHSAICKHIRLKHIFVNDQKIKSGSLMLSVGDKIRLIYINLEDPDNKKDSKDDRVHISKERKKEVSDSIIFKDDKIIVINKPYNLASQSGGSLRFSLDSIARELYGDNTRIVHRLDKETSGLMVLARNREVAQILFNAFKERKIEKAYLAVIGGILDKKSGRIESYIKDAGRVSRNIRNKQTSIQDGSEVTDQDGKYALTLYKVLKEDPIKNVSLVELKPKTGRTHQLRVHCADCLNAPIIGDYRYGGNISFTRKLNLFAYKLKLPEIIHNKWFVINETPSFFVLKN